MSTHTFQIGDYTCHSLVDFTRVRSLRHNFPKINPAELTKEIEALGLDLTVDTEIPLHGSALLIDTGEKKILIDAGLSTAAGGHLVQSLANLDLTPEDIDLVVVTHGDGDHIGGLGNYAKAKIVMPTNSYKLWTQDTDGMVEDFIKLFREVQPEEELAATAIGRAKYADVLDQLGDRVVLVEFGEEIAPGISMFDASGHRRDHAGVQIISQGESLLHIADAWRHPIQLKRPDFYCLFDSDPETLATTMNSLLEKAAQNDAVVFGAHFPFPAIIKIAAENGAYQWINL